MKVIWITAASWRAWKDGLELEALHLSRAGACLLQACSGQAPPLCKKQVGGRNDDQTGPEATIDALMSAIAYFRIAPLRAKAILSEVEWAVASWREEGQMLGMSTHELESFTDAFEHGERRAVQRVLG